MKVVRIGICLLSMLFQIADAKPTILPALIVEPVEILDEAAYARVLSAINAKMKMEHAVPLFLRAYYSDSLDGGMQSAFALSPALTFEALLKNQEVFGEDFNFVELRAAMAAVCQSSGPKTYLKAVRFDGTNSPGVLLNSLVKTDSESMLLEHLEEWMQSVAGLEVELPKLNVFRVISGEGSFTHLVSFNLKSVESAGLLMDQLAVLPLPVVNESPTVLYHEISPTLP